MLIVILAIAALIVLFAMARVSQTGQAPGIVDGRLTRCPDKQNCVCSEYRKDDGHFIEPLELAPRSAEDAAATMRAVIIESGGAIRSERNGYLAATFSSSLFGFVDDLEIRIDEQTGLLHFRSASRVGYGDLGANRKRVEALKTRFRQSRAGNRQ